MSVGLRVRDNVTGEVTVEVADRLVRLIGTIRITSAPGSFVVPGASSPFFYLTSDSNGSSIPPVTISGRTLSWPLLSPSFPNRNQVDFWIAYGEY